MNVKIRTVEKSMEIRYKNRSKKCLVNKYSLRFGQSP